MDRILEANEQIKVYLAGGLREHQDTVGSSVIQFSSDFEADIGIYGCGSVTDHHFAMEHEEVKADLSKSIIKNSRESWLVADDSKWRCFALTHSPLPFSDTVDGDIANLDRCV